MTDDQSEPGGPHEVRPLDVSQLGLMLRERRGKLSMRKAAQEAGVSFSTFSRVEAGSHPDLTSFTHLCAWLGVEPSYFFNPAAPREVEPIDIVIGHLHNDPRLEPDAAQQITDVLRGMYQALATEVVDRAVVACHLRAAATMRPGVPERLNGILAKMHAELDRKVATGEL